MGPKGSICEVRLGNFFDVVSTEEIAAATLMVLQVCLPQPVWPRVRELLCHTRPGCRLLLYEAMGKLWEGSNSFPFAHLSSPLLACSWSPKTGHRFHCYERAESLEEGSPFAEE